VKPNKANKKAMIAENMSELGVAMVIVIIAFILLSIASNMNKTQKLDKGRDELNKAIFQNTIALYLKQPVEVSGFESQGLTMADLIVLAGEDEGSYGAEWGRKTDAFFSNIALPGKITRLKITINDDSGLSTDKKFEGKKDNDPLSHETEVKLSDWVMYFPGHLKPVKVLFESYGLRVDFYYK
jgi:hypothetical protein